MLNHCIWPGCLASCIVLWNIYFWHGSLNSVRAEASIWVMGDYTTRNCTCRLYFLLNCWTPACTVKFLLVENNVILWFEFLPYLWCRESIRQSSWQWRGHILSAHITVTCCNVYNSPQANWQALFRINGLLVNFPPLPQMMQQSAKDPQIVTPSSETTFGTGCIVWVEMSWGGNLLSNTLLFRMDQIRWGRKSL